MWAFLSGRRRERGGECEGLDPCFRFGPGLASVYLFVFCDSSKQSRIVVSSIGVDNKQQLLSQLKFIKRDNDKIHRSHL